MSEFKLKKIILHNIFNYYRDNELNFDTDHEGNVFLFNVENGGGKTSLFLAIKWGFYGNDSGITYEKEQRKLTNKDFLNTDAKKLGINSFQVDIHFTYGEDDYFLTRTCENAASNNSTLTLKCNQIVLSANEAKQRVLDLIPPDYGDFFMFNGEMLSDIAMNQKSPRKIDGVMKLLGLKQLKDLYLSLEQVKSNISTQLNKAMKKTRGINDGSEEIDRQYNLMENLKEIIKKNEETLKELQNQLSEAEAEFFDYKTLDESVKAIDNAKQQDDLALERFAAQKEKLKSHSGNFYLAFLEFDIRKAIDTCESEKSTLSQMASISDEQAEIFPIQLSILQNHMEACPVCKSTLGTEELNILQEILSENEAKQKRYSENKIRLNFLKGQIDALKEAYKGTEFDFQHELDTLFELSDRKSETERKYNELSKLAQDSDREVIKALSARIIEFKSKIESTETQIKTSKSGYSIAESQYNQLTAKRKSLGQASREENALSKQYDYVTSVMDGLNKVIEKASFRKRGDILKKANEVFLKITNKPDTYDHLEYEDDSSFAMVIIKHNGDVVMNPSSGENHVLAISFLVSLSLNTDSKSTMMMDTPLARLDPTHSANIGALLASLDNQVIFLAQPSELAGPVRKNLSPAVAKEFVAELTIDNRANIHEVVQ